MNNRYFEGHITVEPGLDWEYFRAGTAGCGFRASRFDEDHVDEAHGKWFLSFRADDATILKNNIKAMIYTLRGLGYTVLRWKVEQTILDSALGDSEETL